MQKFLRKFVALIVTVFVVVTLLPLQIAFADATVDTRGTAFYLSVPDNINAPSLFLYISSETEANVNVSIPSQAVDDDIVVDANSVYTYDLPEAIELSATGTSSASIYVTSDEEISVYIANISGSTSDAYVGLPVDGLGTEYYVVGYQGAGDGYIATTATQDATDVEIFNAAGVSVATATIDTGEIYYYENAVTDDISGFSVVATLPVSVVSGNTCANVPVGASACDFIAEMIPPTDSLGTEFYSFQLGGRLNGDTFVVVATEDDTTITVDGTISLINRGGVAISTYTTPDPLDAGAKLELILTSGGEISADKPVLVAHFAHGTSFDGQTGDPFMTILPPFEQFLASYNVTTPASGFGANYITLIAKTSELDTLEVNDVLVDPEDFTQIGDSDYSGDSMAVDAGSYAVTSSTPFGIEVYGFNAANSYGYPAGIDCKCR